MSHADENIDAKNEIIESIVDEVEKVTEILGPEYISSSSSVSSTSTLSNQEASSSHCNFQNIAGTSKNYQSRLIIDIILFRSFVYLILSAISY